MPVCSARSTNCKSAVRDRADGLDAGRRRAERGASPLSSAGDQGVHVVAGLGLGHEGLYVVIGDRSSGCGMADNARFSSGSNLWNLACMGMAWMASCCPSAVIITTTSKRFPARSGPMTSQRYGSFPSVFDGERIVNSVQHVSVGHAVLASRLVHLHLVSVIRKASRQRSLLPPPSSRSSRRRCLAGGLRNRRRAGRVAPPHDQHNRRRAVVAGCGTEEVPRDVGIDHGSGSVLFGDW